MICGAASAQQQFAISPLGYRTDSLDTVPGLINNLGTVVGNAIVGAPSGQMPFFLSNGAPVPFPTSPGNSVFSPHAINNSGEVAGFLMADAQNPEPSFYSAAIYENGQYVELQPPDANVMNDYRASGINNNGDAVGYVTEGNGLSRAVEWINGQPQFLDSNINEINSANAINDNGWIAGALVPANGEASYPVIWHDGTVTTISLPVGAIFGTATNINNTGQVLVSYCGQDQNNHLMLWNNGIATVLPELADTHDGAYAGGMNSFGVVVGMCDGHAVYWQDGQIFDLNNLIEPNSGWFLLEASSINDAGDIVGLGQYEGVDMPFLLTPTGIASIPEPAAISLTMAAGMLLRRRCRR
ncbi:MAG TPA: hypothetical protein VGG19_00745 [Tepidisphaeraceae bacterium]|jgi:uncharacterized membrane protein